MIARRALLLAAAAAPVGIARAADPALIAVVLPGSPAVHAHMLVAFRRGLAQAGLAECRDVVLAIHYLDGDFGRLPPLARPGGNVTGLSNLAADLVEKQFALVTELLPRTRRVLGLRGAQPGVVFERMDVAFVGVAERFGIAVPVVLLDERSDLEPLRAVIAAERPEALFVLADPIALARRRAIVAVADAAKLPIVAPFREFPEAGVLASYGASVAHAWERTANYVDRILKGANPAEMPIEQPTRFELVVNLKTARTLGLTIPVALLAVADEVIE